MAMNLFTSAKVAPAKKSAKKDRTPRIDIEGLQTYSFICVVEKALKGLKETYRGIVETHMTDQFVLDGIKAKARPANFKGTEGAATASCELRKRTSASSLSDVETQLLDKLGIAYEAGETKFVINPDYACDSELLQKVSDALAKVKGLPSDFIVAEQAGAKVSDDALDQIFSLKEKDLRQVLPIVGTMAIKPVMAELDLDEAMEKLSEVMKGE